jgi:hypothetical protein
MAESVVTFAAVAGVLVLRARGHVETGTRIHRTWIINPLIYCAVIAFVFVRSAVKHPVEGIVIVIFNLAGMVVYRLRLWERPLTMENGRD